MPAAAAAAAGSLAGRAHAEASMKGLTSRMPRACGGGSACCGSSGSGNGGSALTPLPRQRQRQRHRHLCGHHQQQHGGRRRLAVAVHASADGDVLQTRELAEQRRRALLSYVKQVQPQLIERFVERGPPAVVGAMRHTIQNLLGTLPPSFFTITISTVGENLGQLMLSVMMTGVLLRNLQYRLDLRSALGGDVDAMATAAAAAAGAGAGGGGGGSLSRAASAAPAAAAAAAPALPVLDERLYAPGTQKARVQGDVLLWHHENGVETLDAKDYITALEQEVARLRAQLGGGSSSGGGSSLGSMGSSSSESGDEAEQQQQPPSPSASAASGQPPQPSAAAAPLQRPLPAPLSRQQPQPPQPQPPQSPQLAAFGGGGGGVATSAAGLLLHGGDEPAAANELLDYLRRVDAAGVAELTGGTGPEVAAAMDQFVLRLMGSDREALARAGSECTAQELARVMFWCLVVGYTLRGMEVRFELVQRAGGAVASWAVGDSWQVWN